MAREKSKPKKSFSDFLYKSGIFSVNSWLELNCYKTDDDNFDFQTDYSHSIYLS